MAERQRFTTAKGRCEWAKILAPDYQHDKNGVYSIVQYLSDEDAQPHIEAIRNAVGLRAQMDGNPGYADPPFKKIEETGEWRFSFKQQATKVTKEGKTLTFRIHVEDKACDPWDSNLLIGNGSIVRVCYHIYDWNVKAVGGIGCTLNLEAVQVIDHVPYEEKKRDFGFIAEGPSKSSEMGFKDETNVNGEAPVYDDIPF